MKVSELRRILEYNELGMENIETWHDAIFLPIEDDIDMTELLELGIIYSEDYDNYIHYT